MLGTRIFHCKYRFGTLQMSAITLQNLDLYPTMDQKQMKTIDPDYNVRVGYWASMPYNM
jgi:hypothetical protein